MNLLQLGDEEVPGGGVDEEIEGDALVVELGDEVLVAYDSFVEAGSVSAIQVDDVDLHI